MLTVPVVKPVEDRHVRASDTGEVEEVILTAQALENAAKKLRDAVERGAVKG